MGCVYDHILCMYVKVVHSHKQYNHEVDSKNEEEKGNAPKQVAPEPLREVGSLSQVTLDMLVSIQSIITEGFANMTKRF